MTEAHSHNQLETYQAAERIIRPPSKVSFGLSELWQYKELLYFFSWREYKIRYRQTLLGLLWTLLQPSLMACIFVVLLSVGLRIGPPGWGGILFFYSGMVVWQLFSQTVSQATQAVVSQSAMIQKIYFPRLILPFSAAINASLDYGLQTCLLVLLVALAGGGSNILALVPCIITAYAITLLTSTGIGCLLSALNVRYRDVRYALPFLIQCIFFLTPVLYDVSSIQHAWVKPLIQLNPMSLAADCLRKGMTGHFPEIISGEAVLPLTISIGFFLCGLYIFRKNETSFADVI
jgi:lipopolysaccharide transport system permease protein